MQPMGRRRTRNFNLPPRMHTKGGAFYHVAHVDGRRIWTPLGTDHSRALLEWARLERVETARTIRDGLARHRAALKVKPSTAKLYGYYERLLNEEWGERAADGLTRGEIAEFFDAADGKALAHCLLTYLSAAYDRMVRYEWVTSNPCVGAWEFTPTSRTRYLEDAEFVAIRDALEDAYRCAVMVSYLTGARVSDVAKIHRADVREEGLYVQQQKTGAKQLFVWTPELRAVVDQAIALQGTVASVWLFPGRRRMVKGKWRQWHVLPGTLSKAFSAAAKDLGIKDVRFHDIRGKAATDAQNAGQNHQALLGHTTQAQSDAYVKRRATPRVQPLKRFL